MVVSVRKFLKKALPYVKCFFGFHKWDYERLMFRECSVCGKQEIREPMPPDGILTGWKDNY